jgi:hypothetical protein
VSRYVAHAARMNTYAERSLAVTPGLPWPLPAQGQAMAIEQQNRDGLGHIRRMPL